MEQAEQGVALQEATEQTPQEELPEYRKIKHKVKVEGQDMELDYDDLIKGYQMSEASQKRFREASELDKQIKQQQAQLFQFFDGMKKDPYEGLKQLAEGIGLNFDEIAENRVAKKIEWDMMPEEKRRLLEMQKKLSEYENKDKSYQQEQESRRRLELENQATEEIDKVISDMMSQAGFKVNPRVLAAMATELYNDIANDRPLNADTVKHALVRGRKALTDDYGELLKALPIQQVIEVLPKETQKELRAYWTKQVTEGKPFSLPKPTGDKSHGASQRQAKRMGIDDYFKERFEK